MISISGHGLDPVRITQILSIEPTKSGVDSTTESDEQERTAYVSFWDYQPPADPGNIWDHIDYWIHFIEEKESKIEEIMKLKETTVGDVRVMIRFKSEYFMLTPEQMHFFSKHKIHIQHNPQAFK